MVNAAFEELSADEKECTLVSAVVCLDLIKKRRVSLTTAVLVGVGIGLGFVVGGGLGVAYGLHYISGWQLGLCALAAAVIYFLVQAIVRGRRIVYRLDHRVTEVMGRPFTDLMLDLDRRQRSEFSGPVSVCLKLAIPSEIRRTQRLDAIS
ncbi:hypothetical protein [Nocardia sp. NPDC052566]|uniref:hypothetical protein n=1 Tax=Nocardia sp. NPDC052566 TaxID=3364330 RepID=UPI0037C789FB